jgi:hypothetical protein
MLEERPYVVKSFVVLQWTIAIDHGIHMAR